MKKLLTSHLFIIAIFSLLFVSLKSFALNYTISFTGTGASTTVESVIVQNLTKGTTVTVPNGNVLNLTDVATSIEKEIEMANGINIYPNPIHEKSTVSFIAKSTGIAQINIFSLEGKKLIGLSRNFTQGNNSFQVTVPNGVFLLQVQGNGFSYNTKLISRLNPETKSQITFTSDENQFVIKPQKSKSAVTTMLYTAGDQLLYKGISGNYCTIVTDKPTESNTTNFEFIECKDADNNYYSVVKIGNQTWMAENLKTSRYQNSDLINTTSPATKDISIESNPSYQWSFDGNESNVADFGRLYTWFAINDIRNVSPFGWHISSDEEWKTMEQFLGMSLIASNDVGWRGLDEGSKLKSVQNWSMSSNSSNSTGFSAIPAGARDINNSFNSLVAGYWWCSNEYETNYAWSRSLFPDHLNTSRGWGFTKKYGLSVRCVKNIVPTLTTTTATAITLTDATSGGNITDDGGATISAYGVCWSTNHNPAISDSKTIDGSGINTFSSSMTGLLPNTTYYYRAYATNSSGTAYGSELSFNTSSILIGDTFSDGIVFYLDGTGKHGLVCALTNQTNNINWYKTLTFTGATGTAIGTGKSNTNTIVSNQGSGSYAARICYDLSPVGTWYLPSKDELNLIYLNLKKNGLGNLSNFGYWSSSEISTVNAWYQDFANGNQNTGRQGMSIGIRAIKSF